jgi:hypothetical protein
MREAQERPLLRALPDAGAFDSTEIASVRVDSKALVTVRQNRYSVPVALAGLRVTAAVGATEIRKLALRGALALARSTAERSRSLPDAPPDRPGRRHR